MCGIYGAVKIRQNSNIKFTTNGINTLKHRGPDNIGTYSDDNVFLGHTRLSIIDIESGNQPIFNENSNMCIIFNGEIYNYLELKKELEEKGHQFRTDSDTETILHAYEQWGDKCVNYLRGMFAFAIWNKNDKILFLARDRLGIKPLFYCVNNGIFQFGSEMKAILCNKTIKREIDEFAVACFFNLSYIPAPYTIYEKIKKLLPGHTLTISKNGIKIEKYWDLYFYANRSYSKKYYEEKLSHLIKEAVEMRLVSEVPLGAFLSGGVDSSTIVAFMTNRNILDKINTFSIGFKGNIGGYLDETKYARIVSKKFETNHREFSVSPMLNGLIDKIVESFDEPFADDSAIPSYFLCKLAKENVTVALSGLGGDEAFAGYERYLGMKIRKMYSIIPNYFRSKVLPSIVSMMPERSDGHYTVNHFKRFIRAGSYPDDVAYINYISLMNYEISDSFFNNKKKYYDRLNNCKELLMSYYNSENVKDNRNPLNKALYCDIKTYLPEDILSLTDRMSMQHSLEVRVPFIDHKLIEFSASIPPEMKITLFQKKKILKNIAKKYIPKEIISHRKQGFAAPMAQWIKFDLKEFILDSLNQENLNKHGIINTTTVNKILKEHFDGKEMHDTLIWSLIIFQKWFDMYLD